MQGVGGGRKPQSLEGSSETLALKYGVHPKQIRRYRVQRFVKLSEDARTVVANMMKRSQK